MTTNLLDLTAVELASGYRTHAFSPVDVIERTLEAARQAQGTLNPFAVLDEGGALEAARRSEERWMGGAPLSPLDGVPVSIKDNIYAAGMPTRFGSLAIPPEATEGPDSPSTARLREAGALIFAKTTLPDYAHKSVTDSPLTGVTRNPWKLDYSPGGSSGGAAAAVSAGIGPLALGSDGGGSVRVPAAWTGIFGLKPSFGRVPHHPRGAFAPLSHIGPMTRTVTDAALVLNAIARPDARDWYALPANETNYLTLLESGIGGLRIALSSTLGIAGLEVDPEILAAVEGAARAFEAMGCRICSADPPSVAECSDVGDVHWVAFSALLEHRLRERSALLDPSLRRLADIGRALPPMALVDAYVRRSELGSQVEDFFEDYDLLLAPVAQMTAPTLASVEDEGAIRPAMTIWCNMTGLPAASICCGFTRAGLPIGLQIIGGRHADAEVMRAARAFERARTVEQPLNSPWRPQ
jgi:aspartyl-tRNA(Asn)/glutamyl-tRNA(Gln) amidotransferase subunit A